MKSFERAGVLFGLTLGLVFFGATSAWPKVKPEMAWKVLAQQKSESLLYRVLATTVESDAQASDPLMNREKLEILCSGSIDSEGSWYFLLTARGAGQEAPEHVLAVTRGIGAFLPLQSGSWMAALDVSELPETVRVSWVLVSSPWLSENRIYSFETLRATDEVNGSRTEFRADLWAQVVKRDLERPFLRAKVERGDTCIPGEVGLSVRDGVWSLNVANPDFGSCGRLRLSLDTHEDPASWRGADHEANSDQPGWWDSSERDSLPEVFDTDGCEVIEALNR